MGIYSPEGPLIEVFRPSGSPPDRIKLKGFITVRRFVRLAGLSVAAAAAVAAIYDEGCNEESPEAVVIHTHNAILLIFMSDGFSQWENPLTFT